MFLPVFFRWNRDVNNKVTTGTFSTSMVHCIAPLGLCFRASHDKQETVKCEFHSYRGLNDDFSYKIKAVPISEEDKNSYGVETYYTSDFENLIDGESYTIDGWTSEIDKELGKIYRNFTKNSNRSSMVNTYENGTIEHFYMNELIEGWKKEMGWEARVVNSI